MVRAVHRPGLHAPMNGPIRLWHFTCSHSAAGITRERVLRPHRHPYLREPLLWLTDLDSPAFRDALGLTSYILKCDRTEHRFSVLTDAAVWWPTYARSRINPQCRRALENAPGVMPAHWWVSTEPIPIEEITTPS